MHIFQHNLQDKLLTIQMFLQEDNLRNTNLKGLSVSLA
jgi:hypothetical protein